jgi:hypothetical protein
MIWVNLKLLDYNEVIRSIDRIEKQNYDSAAENKLNYETEEDYQ